MDMNKNGRNNAVIYNRVSTQDQIDRTSLNSLTTHQESCFHYIKSKEWNYLRTYEDPAISGSTLNRPALQRMLSDICRSEIDHVIIYKLDRISRSVKDFHEILSAFEEYGISLVSVTQGLDTSTPSGRLMRNILMDFAEFEREMISERTKDKMLASARKGLWNGGNILFGYKTEGGGKLVIEPEEARIVREMFDVYRKTRSLAKAIEYANAMDYRNRSGKKWAKSTVWNILTNPIYGGKISYGGQTFDGLHEGIVDWELFTAFGFMDKDRSHIHMKNDRVFLLRGLLKCDLCKSTLTPFWVQKRNGKKIFYYRCTRTSLYKEKCPLGQINAAKIEELVEEKIEELVEKEGFLEDIIKGINFSTGKNLSPLKEEKEEIEKRLRQIQSKMDNYLEVLGEKGSFLISMVEKKIEKLKAEEILLLGRLDEIKVQLESVPGMIDASLVLERLRNFRELIKVATDQEKARIFTLIIKNIRVSREELTLNIFDLSNSRIDLEGLKNRPFWLPGTNNLRTIPLPLELAA